MAQFLYNNQTNRMEKVPDEAITDGVFNGTYSFKRGTAVPVITPDGRVATVDAEDFTPEYGYRFATRADIDARYKAQVEQGRAEAFGGSTMDELAAGAAGVLRAGTFGASDALGAAVGLGDELSMLKEYNPNASLAGEALGTVASIATGIGAGSAAMKIGEKAAGKIFTGAASKATDRIIKAGLGSAVEGALYSTGSVISEAALGDPNLNVQNALTEIGLGTVLGGGLGALGKGAGEGVSKLWSMLKDSTLPNTAADIGGKVYAKLSSVVKGLDDDAAKDLERAMATKEGRQLAFNGINDPEIIERNMLNQVDNILTSSKNINAESMNIRDVARHEILDLPVDLETGPAWDFIDQLNKTAKLIESSAKYSSKDAPRLRAYVADFKSELKKTKSLGDVHKAVENIRKRVDNFTDFGMDVSKGVQKDTTNLFRDLRKQMKGFLEDENVFGTFGQDYKKVNEAYSMFRHNEKQFAKLFGKRVPTPSGEMTTIVDPVKVSAFVKNPEAMRNMAKDLNLEDMLSAITKLADNTPGGLTGYADTVNGIKNAISTVKDTRAVSLMLNRLESQTGKSLTGLALGGLVGGNQDIPGGALTGAGIGFMLTNPKTVLRHLVRLEQLGQKGSQRTVSAVEQMLGKGISTVKPVGKLAASSAPQVTVGMLNSLLGGDEKEDFTQFRDRLMQHNIQQTDDLITAQNPLLNSASPEHHAALVNQAQKAIEFVRSKIKTDPSMTLVPGDAVKTSSMKHDLAAYIDGAFRPQRMLEELKKPMPDARVIEAVANVYPDLYQQVVSMIVDGVTQNPRKLDYKQKLKLGIFLRTPTTPAMGSLDQIQGVYGLPNLKENMDGSLSIDTAAVGVVGDFA